MTRITVDEIRLGEDEVVAEVHAEFDPKDPQFMGIFNIWFYVGFSAEAAKDMTVAQIREKAEQTIKAFKWPTD